MYQQCVNCTAPHDGGPLDRCLNCQSRAPLTRGAVLTRITGYRDPAQGRLQIPAEELTKTGYAFDERMLLHREVQAVGGGRPSEHPERPNRVRSMWQHINKLELLKCGYKIPPRLATQEELLGVHSKEHCAVVDALSAIPEGIHFGGDTYACADSSVAARLSCAGVIDAAEAVLTGKCENAVAIVRPPGHHAEESQACGFCLYNNVAVAARALLDRKLARRVLVVDWDVHHGNGIQNIFYGSPDVLYVSLHRFERHFFPGTGHPFEAGEGKGLGYNINIAWSEGEMGDAE
jgi:histone deacetylase 6